MFTGDQAMSELPKAAEEVLKLRVQELESVLHKIHANAAESPDWIRYRIEQVMPNVKGA
jgi:hypothetical protein